ncbi:MAG TPA: RebB family R body protein [Burkholderiaceae bacterium]|nr:RebB family R body protein [Burkholderiaceae bacterium]
MAYPTAVNNQITDAVTQANVKVPGDAPAMAMGQLFEATNAQQQANAPQQASTTQGVSTLSKPTGG